MSALAVLEKFYRAVYNACDKKSKYPLKFSKQKPPIMSVGDRLSGVALCQRRFGSVVILVTVLVLVVGLEKIFELIADESRHDVRRDHV